MSSFIKSLFTGTLVTVSLAIVGVSQASAATMTATLTADNHYGLFTGNEDGSQLNFIGRNEKGASGNPGQYNWSEAETWTFNITSNDYIYAVIWDDAAVAESWIGEFTLPDGKQLLSTTDNWEYIVTNKPNPGDNGDVPALLELEGQIKNADWVASQSVGLNGVKPWGMIAGISPNASFLNVSNSQSKNYTIFRTKHAGLASVPEPTSALGLLAFGAVSSGLFVKRKANKV